MQTGVILAVDSLAVVPNICVTEAPVQNLPATDELSLQTSTGQSQDTPEKDEVDEGQETETGASRKCRNGQEKKVSSTVSGKNKRKGNKNPKHSIKQGQENKNSEEHTADGESKLSIKRTASKGKETSVLVAASFTTASNRGKSDIFSQQKTVNKDVSNTSSRSASAESEAHFLYYKTPAKLQQMPTKDIENKNKQNSLVDSHNHVNGDSIEESDENTKVENTSKIYFENLNLVDNEDFGEMLEQKRAREIKDATAANESQKLEDKAEKDMSAHAEGNRNAEIETASQDIIKSGEIQMLSDAVEALPEDEPSRTAAKVKKQKNTIPKKGNKKKETENANLHEYVQGVGKKNFETCIDGNSENRYERVLRCRTKKQRSEVERKTSKPVAQKKVPKKTRQREVTSKWDIKKVITQKKSSIKNLDNYNAPSLHTSSPGGELLSQQTNLSSPETDRITDSERLHKGIVTCTSAYRGSHQAETEVPRESEQFVSDSIQSNPLGDYNSVPNSRSSSHNRIKKSKENGNKGSFQDSPEGMKSTFRKHQDIREYECLSKNKTAETDSDKQNIASSTVLYHGDTNNRSCSREDDSSENHHAALTTRNGQNAVEFSTTNIRKSDKKEKEGKAKMVGKKRKPTTSEHECLAFAFQQSSSDALSVLDCTKKRKTLFNSRENSLLPSLVQSVSQVSFSNTTLSKNSSNTGIPASLSAFMRSFIAPKLKKTG